MLTSQTARYLWAFNVSVGVYFVLSIYLLARRGSYDLFIANKAIAGVSFVLVCLVLLLGPFSRLYQIYDRFIIMRKELGMVAFCYGLMHAIISFFFLPDHFPITHYQNNLFTFFFGLVSTATLTILFIFSFSKIIQRVERKRWWHLQNIGIRVAGIAVLLHVLPMKYPGWIAWYTRVGADTPYLPPMGVMVIAFGIFVLGVRLSEFLGPSRARIFVMLSALALLKFIVMSFIWGAYKTSL